MPDTFIGGNTQEPFPSSQRLGKPAEINLVDFRAVPHRLIRTLRHPWGRTMPHRKYRALERDCHRQAAITGNKEAKKELEKMEREYKLIAD